MLVKVLIFGQIYMPKIDNNPNKNRPFLNLVFHDSSRRDRVRRFDSEKISSFLERRYIHLNGLVKKDHLLNNVATERN